MNLDELQSVQSRERQTDGLQQLRPSFYEDAATFVNELREQRERAASKAEDPFDSPEVNRLTDDIRTAEQTVEAIYERRVGKVVKMASLAAADMPTEQDGLTNEEQELFETMVAAIEDHRATILDVLGGDAPAGSVASPPTDGRTETPDADDANDVPGARPDRVDAAAAMGDSDAGASEAGASTDETAPDESLDSDPEPGGSDTRDSPGSSDVSPSESSLTGASGSETPPPDASGSDAPPPDASPSNAPPSDEESTGAPGTSDGPAVSSEQQSAAVDTERVTVRITEDVGEIFGVDEREYDLLADDVVTLPVTNAEPLIDRDAAERLE